MEKIEDMEQLLLQHIRTSGIRSSKESSLIDEMLDLRKERRKLFTQLIEKNQQLHQENELIKEEYRQGNQKQEKILSLLREQHEIELAKREEEFHQREASWKHELALLQENHKLLEEKNTESFRHAYEVKLAKLETKLKQVLKEKEMNDLSKAKQMAEKFIEKALVEMEEGHKKKITEYKEALRNIADREKDLQGSNQRYKELTETLKTENEKLNVLLTSLQDKIEIMFKREKDLELLNQDVAAKSNDSRKEIDQLKEKIENQKKLHEKQIQHIHQTHQQKLAEIDEKIRKMIQAKNKEITQLQHKVQSQQQQYQELEETLNELNRNLASLR